MSLRPQELELLNTLTRDSFGYIERDIIHIDEIMDIIKSRYPHLCDDTYLSSMHRKRKDGRDEPEWCYVVRYSLNKHRKDGYIKKFPIPDFWDFTE